MKQLGIFIFLLFLLQNSFAQEKSGRFKIFKEDGDQRAFLKNSKPLSVYYENIGWNQNPTIVDSGYLYLRDRDTNEITELKLTETEPNSSIFNIDFPIGVLKQENVAAEVYSVPPTMLTGKDRMDVVKSLVKDKSIKRKPFLLRVLREKGQILDVFDNREAAITAYNEYKKQMGLNENQVESASIIQVTNNEKPVTKKAIDTSTLQSLFMANENNLASSNDKNRELREVLKNIEQKRRQKIKDDAKTWSTTQVDANNAKATAAIKQGVIDIEAKNFNGSVDNFYKASDLMASNEDVYEQYGVSLFRQQKYNQAIVILELAEPSSERVPEKEFYIGMSYYELKDYEKAVEHFDKVMNTKDKAFSATAAFYKGSALIELHRFDEAQATFQYVLDNSDDPNMDQRAEKYIEYALDRKSLEEKRSNRFFIDGVLGLIFDSNIILAKDQALQQGLVSNQDGWRLLGQFSPKYRPYYSESDEVAVSTDITMLKSFDTGFGSNPTVEKADPMMIGLNVPWTHRTTLDGKGYFFDLIPSYEIISMDLDGKGNEVITKSIRGRFNNTLVANKNWIAKTDFFVSSNDSDILGDSTSADSLAGGFKLSSIIILNKDLERYLIPELGYQINDAKAALYNFNRMDMALTYTSSIFESVMWNNRFGYYLANYENGRVDNNWSITSGVSTRISSHWNWGIMGSYIMNDSTLNNYNKYNFVTTFSFSY